MSCVGSCNPGLQRCRVALALFSLAYIREKWHISANVVLDNVSLITQEIPIRESLYQKMRESFRLMTHCRAGKFQINLAPKLAQLLYSTPQVSQSEHQYIDSLVNFLLVMTCLITL